MTLTATSSQHAGAPVLLTGATGFVGMELLVRLLEQTDRDVVALVRAADDARRRRRASTTLLQMLVAPGVARRIAAACARVAADLESPGPRAVADRTRDRLDRERSASVVHCAASVSFTLELEDARRINVEGTREILELAREARDYGVLDRVVHVSTAYVAGERGGRASRAPRRRRPGLSQHLRAHEARGRAARARQRAAGGDRAPERHRRRQRRPAGRRPSTSSTGRCRRSRAGSSDAIPGDPDAPIDIVPVDTVADALLELVRGPVRCGTFHVVAGDEAPSRTRELATMAAEFFDAEPPRFVGPGVDPIAEKRAGALRAVLQGALHRSTRCARGALLGATPPPLGDVLPRADALRPRRALGQVPDSALGDRHGHSGARAGRVGGPPNFRHRPAHAAYSRASAC